MKPLIFLTLILFCSMGSAKNEKIILGGGGEWPDEMRMQFLKWAKDADVVCLNYGSKEEPYARMERLWARFKTERPDGRGLVEGVRRDKILSKDTKVAEKASKQALLEIQRASMLHFHGGNQDAHMEVHHSKYGKPIAKEILKRYQSGTPISTSGGGTASMATQMITSVDGKPVLKPGLGLLPKDILIDQHVKEENREGRLTQLWKENKDIQIAIGVDDDEACILVNEVCCTAAGADQVLILDKGATPSKTLLRNGETYHLRKHIKVDDKDRNTHCGTE